MTNLIERTQTVLRIKDRNLGQTNAGREMTWYVDEQVSTNKWREEEIPVEVSGLSRPIQVFRAARNSNLITYDWHGDKNTFCPPMWWDLAIGSGACGLGCRACFLMLTHRIKRDPFRHLLYDNLSDFEKATVKWLTSPERKKLHTLGIGIDRSDSLLYEGIAPHVRNLAPLFGSDRYNHRNNKLILLTKTANTHYLADISSIYRQNIVVSFSLNPQPIADLWEGKWPDTQERITPTISQRLQAAKYAQELGFEVRVRVDPILTVEKWLDYYQQWVLEIKRQGINFRYWTLGTYREKNTQLDAWRERWGLMPMDWQPNEEEMVKQGTHRHLPEIRRVEIYRTMQEIIRHEFPQARISLCKETHSVRRAVSGMCNADCNCLI